MNFHWIDWTILGGMLVLICGVAYSTKRHNQSVADFLVANRCAGKYMLGTADGIAGLGAITIVAFFEMHYKSGFCGVWWNTLMLPVGVIVALTGWVQYRYRQTRAMTMAQFMEMRYSRNFRVFAGIMCFFSGIINFGIFPAVGGRFFQYYCGLPPVMMSVGFTEIDLTFAAIMAALLTISLAFTFMGGQIAVTVTDFVQGTFCNIAFCIIAGYLLFFHFDWAQMMEAVTQAPENASLINPAKSGDTENYDATYFFVGIIGIVLNWMAWQGNQGYYGAARTPHAARIGRVVGNFRGLIQTTPIVLLAVGAYTVMHHVDFTAEAAKVQAVLDGIGNEKLQSQQLVSIAAAHILPIGLVGIFGAVMFAAFVSTHDTYLHSWGSIFIQDVILPARRIARKDDTPLSTAAHMRLLKISMVGVALFIFCFSLFFPQKLDVLMFFALTGTFYLGWAGWAIVGGLYWKYGNSTGAWAGAIVGLIVSVAGWALIYQWRGMQSIFGSVMPATWLEAEKFPGNAQMLYFWSMVITGVVYCTVSYFTSKKPFNMDRMLHRGDYALADDMEQAVPSTGLASLKMGPQFALDDKLIYLSSMAYIGLFFAVFIVGTVAFSVFGVDFSDAGWSSFWWGFCLLSIVSSLILSIWFAIGGLRDWRALYRRLSTKERDAADDGNVVVRVKNGEAAEG